MSDTLHDPPITAVDLSAFLSDLPTVQVTITTEYLSLRLLVDGQDAMEMTAFLPRPTDPERLASRIIGALNNQIVNVTLGRRPPKARRRPARLTPRGDRRG